MELVKPEEHVEWEWRVNVQAMVNGAERADTEEAEQVMGTDTVLHREDMQANDVGGGQGADREGENGVEVEEAITGGRSETGGGRSTTMGDHCNAEAQGAKALAFCNGARRTNNDPGLHPWPTVKAAGWRAWEMLSQDDRKV